MISNKIDKLIAEAMKQQNKEELKVYRLIKSKLVEFETSGKNVKMTEDEEFKILRKMISQRLESKKIYEDTGRNDLAEAEAKEIEIISKFVPNEPTEDMVREIIFEYKNSLGTDYDMSVKDTKKILEKVKEKYSVANGQVVSKVLKEFIK